MIEGRDRRKKKREEREREREDDNCNIQSMFIMYDVVLWRTR